ncbi:MAG: PAS domain S-box protein [Kofleriaceae bacterium]|nr:PAS domain S-box protein [Kofleriaceae bacterium]
MEQRNQAETSTAVVAARLQAILNSVDDGIITLDERGIIETINPAAEHMFGYLAVDAIGRNVNMLLPEPADRALAGYLARAQATGEAQCSRTCSRVTAKAEPTPLGCMEALA